MVSCGRRKLVWFMIWFESRNRICWWNIDACLHCSIVCSRENLSGIPEFWWWRTAGSRLGISRSQSIDIVLPTQKALVGSCSYLHCIIYVVVSEIFAALHVTKHSARAPLFARSLTFVHGMLEGRLHSLSWGLCDCFWVHWRASEREVFDQSFWGNFDGTSDVGFAGLPN